MRKQNEYKKAERQRGREKEAERETKGKTRKQ